MARPIATIRKNSTETLHVSLDDFRGRSLINLRVFFTAEDGSQRPGKAGVALRVEALPELRAAILEAEAEALRLGLIKGVS
jgi:hypothetical protein